VVAGLPWVKSPSIEIYMKAGLEMESVSPRTQQGGAGHPERAAFAALSKAANELIIGQERLMERLTMALLCHGHLLVEGAPGLAKTTAIKVLADRIEGDFHRIQFTPDLLPADLTGTEIYRPQEGSFEFQRGPIFHNLILADEVNRAPAKVQSALLEVMAEQQVTIGGVTHPVPSPFFVVATQNPIESEGVYQLPDAQRDRFMMKIVMDHPNADEELAIVDRMSVRAPVPDQVLTLEELRSLQTRADEVFVDRSVAQYAVDVVQCTRHPERFGLGDLDGVIALGASPRATLNLVRGARAMALLRGRTYATPQDVFDVAPEVLRHRLLMTYDALARDVSPDDVIQQMLATVPAAWVSPKPNDALDRS